MPSRYLAENQLECLVTIIIIITTIISISTIISYYYYSYYYLQVGSSGLCLLDDGACISMGRGQVLLCLLPNPLHVTLHTINHWNRDDKSV